MNNEQAHRDGKDIDSRPAHILFKLLSYQDKVRGLEKWREALQGQSYFIVDTLQDWTEKETWKDQVKTLFEKEINLCFSAGRWRQGSGEVFPFKDCYRSFH